MTQADLEILLKDLQALPKECEWVEFKENKAIPSDIGEYLSALSNGAAYKREAYGYLVFGIEDDTHRLVGTKFDPFAVKTQSQELEHWLEIHLSPRTMFEIFKFEVEGLTFVIFRIHRCGYEPVKFKGVAYIRIGSHKKKLNEHPQREKVIWSQDSNIPFEKEISMYDVTDNEVLDYIDYPTFFKLLKLPLPPDKRAILLELSNRKVIQENGNKFNITNVGALLFAKELSLFENLVNRTVRVIFYQGKNKIISIKEQFGKKGYAVGFDGLMRYLEEQLPSSEVLGRAFMERKEYPLIAIRELIANALVHQDFSIRGSSIMVEVFSNRIEITNPGNPIIDKNRFVDHNQVSRNEILADFMRKVGICESRGSGFDKVIWFCELYRLPAPDIIVADNYTRIILFGMKSLKELDRADKIRGCYMHCCLMYVNSDAMTNESLRLRFDIEQKNYPVVSKIISDTMAEKLIKLNDPNNRSKKFAKYIPYWA